MSVYSEGTLRKRAYKIGFKIEKGFHHDEDGNLVTREYYGRVTGYQVKDLNDGSYVSDSNIEGGSDYCWNLDMVEDFLKSEYENRGLKW